MARKTQQSTQSQATQAPSRTGEFWSDREDFELLELHRKGQDFNQIGAHLRRTPFACFLRWRDKLQAQGSKPRAPRTRQPSAPSSDEFAIYHGTECGKLRFKALGDAAKYIAECVPQELRSQYTVRRAPSVEF